MAIATLHADICDLCDEHDHPVASHNDDQRYVTSHYCAGVDVLNNLASTGWYCDAGHNFRAPDETTVRHKNNAAHPDNTLLLYSFAEHARLTLLVVFINM